MTIYLIISLLIMLVAAVKTKTPTNFISPLDQAFIVFIGVTWPLIIVALAIHYTAVGFKHIRNPSLEN